MSAVDSDKIARTFGRNLKIIRIHKKMSQEALGEEIGLCRQQVNKHETGVATKPSWDTIQRVSDFTGIPAEKLMNTTLKEEDF